MAEFLDMSPRYLYRLANAPDFPARPAPGRFDPYPVASWYVRRLQAAIDRRGTSDGPALKAAKLALIAGQAAKVEMANAVQRGDLLERDSLTALWSKRLVNCQRRLRSIPSSIGPTLVNQRDPAKCVNVLMAAVDAALTELDGLPGGVLKPSRDGRRRRNL